MVFHQMPGLYLLMSFNGSVPSALALCTSWRLQAGVSYFRRIKSALDTGQVAALLQIGRDIAVARPSGAWRSFFGRRSSRTASMAQSMMADQRDGPICGEVREKQVRALCCWGDRAPDRSSSP